MRMMLVLALLFSACGGNNPAAPTPTQLNLPGRWNGTYASSQLGTGAVQFNLTRQGSAVGGTWSTVANFTGATTSGTVSGSAPSLTSGSTFTVMLSPSDPRTCPFQVTITVLAHLNQLLGDWVTTNCTVAASGTMGLNR